MAGAGGKREYPPLAEGEIDALVVACGLAAVEHRGHGVPCVSLPIDRVGSLVQEVRRRRAEIEHAERRANAAGSVVVSQAQALTTLRERVAVLEEAAEIVRRGERAETRAVQEPAGAHTPGELGAAPRPATNGGGDASR